MDALRKLCKRVLLCTLVSAIRSRLKLLLVLQKLVRDRVQGDLDRALHVTNNQLPDALFCQCLLSQHFAMFKERPHGYTWVLGENQLSYSLYITHKLHKIYVLFLI